MFFEQFTDAAQIPKKSTSTGSRHPRSSKDRGVNGFDKLGADGCRIEEHILKRESISIPCFVWKLLQ